MAFDPDAYLASVENGQQSAFDPDAYLASVDGATAAPTAQKTQEDFLREAAQEMPWGERQIASMGLQLMKGYQGLKGLVGGDVSNEVVQAADVAAREAPVGAIAGEVVKYAPLMAVPGGVLAQAGAGAAMGAAYDPTGKRIESGLLEGALSGAGAAVGKAIPVVAGKTANLINSIKARLGGTQADKYYGGLDRAREALQRIVGEGNIPAARTALSQAGDVRTAQALAEALPRGAAENISVLDRLARREGISAADDPVASAAQYAAQRERQNAAREAVMAQMAEGSSAQDSALARDLYSRLTALDLKPVEREILDRLAEPGRKLSEILPMLKQMESRYVSALQNQGRMAAEAGAAISPVTARGGIVANQQTAALQGERIPSMVRGVGGQPKAIDELGFQRFQNAASQFGDVAAEARAGADALRSQISELPSTFNATPIIEAAERMAQDVGGVRRTVADALLKELRIAGNDPAKIAQVRKLGVNQLIGDLIDSGKLSKTDAAAALTDIKKVIDKQLGPEYVERYLKPYSDALNERSAVDLASRLRDLQKESPKKFIKVMRGDDPDLVAEFGDWKTIQEALGADRYAKASGVAKEIEADRAIKEMAKSTEAKSAVAKVLESEGMERFLPNMLNRYTVLANTALKEGNLKMNAAMYREIDKAMRDPKAMLRLIEMLPPEQRSQMIGFVTQIGKTGSVSGAVAGEEFKRK